MSCPKCDLHTHTCFCDGADSPEGMVLSAISKGMDTIGFSGHAYTSFDSSWCMTHEKTAAYRAEIARLQAEYASRIRILCGIEQDFYAEQPEKAYDYTIGSVHYLWADGVYLPVDESPEHIRSAVREHFGGDIYRFLKCYYETVAQICSKTGCDIVGHFDLVEKFNRGECLFSESDYRYRRVAVDALDALLGQNVIFEINTGAMSRGYCDVPYPFPCFLRRIAEKRGRVILSSDAHRRENLLFAFPDAVRYAHACGIGGLTVFGAHGWEMHPVRV